MNATFRQYLAQGQHAGSRYALASPRSAPSGLAGSQMGQRPGSSLEFMDHREYQPGDDVRLIDWPAYARSDRLTIKLYREEVSPHLDLLLDGSRSMALAGTAKAQAALGLAAMLAVAAGNSSFTHRAFITAGGCREIVAGAQQPTQWQAIALDDPGSPAEAMARLMPAWRTRSLRVFISDLLWLGDPMAVLSPLAHGAASAVVVHLLAAADVDPPARGNIRLVDSEAAEHRDLFIDAGAQARYRDNLHRHRQYWQRACRQVGAVMVELIAEPFVTDWNPGPLLATGVIRPN